MTNQRFASRHIALPPSLRTKQAQPRGWNSNKRHTSITSFVARVAFWAKSMFRR